MPKRVPDMITSETARKVKNMSLPDLNTYLYCIYVAGYSDGMNDRLATAARAAAIEPKTEEVKDG